MRAQTEAIDAVSKAQTAQLGKNEESKSINEQWLAEQDSNVLKPIIKFHKQKLIRLEKVIGEYRGRHLVFENERT